MNNKEQTVLIEKQFCDENKVFVYYPNKHSKESNKGKRLTVNGVYTPFYRLAGLCLKFLEKKTNFKKKKYQSYSPDLANQIIWEQISRQIESGENIPILKVKTR